MATATVMDGTVGSGVTVADGMTRGQVISAMVDGGATVATAIGKFEQFMNFGTTEILQPLHLMVMLVRF